MKQSLLSFLTALLMCFSTACGGDSTETPDPTPNPPTPPVQGDEIVIPEGADMSPTISQDGGNTTIQFTAKERWTASISDTRTASDWISVSPTSGDAGKVSLTIITKRNETTDDRDGFVKIQSGKSQATVSITQKQRDALIVSPSKRTLDARETEFEIEVRANINFEVDIRTDWIEQISTRAMTTTKLTFRAKRNIGEERTGTIIIRSGEKSETITIIQEKGDFIVDTGQFSISASQQTVSAKVRANIDFEVKSQASWIHYNQTRAMISYTLNFDVDENTTGKERTGEIIVSSNGKSETITVVQSGEVFSVKFDKTEFTADGGTCVATVIENLEYSVIIPDNTEWITETTTNTRSAIVQNTHSFSIKAWDEVGTRKAFLKFIYQSEKGAITTQIEIVQKGVDILANKNQYELDANGGQVNVVVSGDTYYGGIEYYITKGVEWISRTETRATTAYFTFNVDKNTTGKQREGEIEFTLPDKTNTKVKIIQLGEVDLINIPDENFKAYMVENFDKNEDGEISKYEAVLITEIYCYDKNIQSLEGIQYCTALTELDCYNNQLTSLDVSECMALARLACSNNQLTSLDVSRNTLLNFLHCSNNQLTSLDVSRNTLLDYLDCDHNQLTSLDVSRNTLLNFLSCYNNQLTSLDVSGCTAWIDLYCHDNQLTSLDVSGCTALRRLSCDHNQLTSLDVSRNTLLDYLDCDHNQLTSLDVSRNTALIELYCYNNQLTNLDVSGCMALTRLDCYNNQLTSLDVSKTYLGDKYLYHSLDCSPMPTLQTLYLQTGWKIYGINYYRDILYVPKQTEILYKD